jgi:hypothetical protein
VSCETQQATPLATIKQDLLQILMMPIHIS